MTELGEQLYVKMADTSTATETKGIDMGIGAKQQARRS